MKSFEFVSVGNLSDAVALLGPGTVVKAGGVDLIDRMKEGIDAPQRLINLLSISGLDYLREEDGELRLGPLATLAAIEHSELVRTRWPALAEACAHAASPQIRNMATLGGNMMQRPRCWYYRSADYQCLKKGGATCFAHEGENQFHAVLGNRTCAMVPASTLATALVAYGAKVKLLGKRGERELLLEAFFQPPEKDVTRETQLGEGELIAELRVPAWPKAGSAYHKQVERESLDWPIAEACVLLDLDGRTCKRASVVLGAAAPVPWRARKTEAALLGRAIDERVADAAAALATSGATPLSKNGYKLPIFHTVVRRAILAAAGVSP